MTTNLPRGTLPHPHPFLQRIRSNSAYPTFRVMVSVFTGLGYLSAVGAALGLGSLLSSTSGYGVLGYAGGVLLGLVVAVLTRVAKEMALMMADVADSAITMGDLWSRNQGRP
ncbi:hypothetical protein LZ017_01175 [Pelomonas sp. CA6]|uniref:hypothetical protein n=1 Tax=Pelomonas sp. CA6 TaxID=2907999 RepID=UPI001F4AE887|nr:hypothetical protein [Pelomonas sp. CA6]MCH7341999.1 hypothetical protein [Pelomonas sp. CA6]